jgi:hypothetical protein
MKEYHIQVKEGSLRADPPPANPNHPLMLTFSAFVKAAELADRKEKDYKYAKSQVETLEKEILGGAA